MYACGDFGYWFSGYLGYGLLLILNADPWTLFWKRSDNVPYRSVAYSENVVDQINNMHGLWA